jgi:hypothetical protein
MLGKPLSILLHGCGLLNNLPTQMIGNIWMLNNETEHNKKESSEDEDILTGSIDNL